MHFVTQESEICLTDGYQVMYFYSPTLPFHRKMLFMLNTAQQENSDIEFLAVDLEQFSSQHKRFGINVLPTILLFNNGKEKRRLEGVISNLLFKDILSDICIYKSTNGDKNAK